MRSLRHILLLIGMTLVYSVYGQGYGDNGVCINYISNEGCIIHREGQDVSSLAIAQGLSTIRDDDLVLKTCVQDFTKFVCASVFPRCNNSSPVVEIIPSCQSTCENARNSCAINSKGALEETQGIIEKYVLSSPLFPQDCTGHPTNECNNSPQLSDRPKCFEPLVEDHIWVNTNKNEVTDRNFCLKGCCLPCPQSYAFYPSNKMKKGFIATQILRALSAVGSGILLVSYLTLPGKRTHPNSLILFASLSIFLYSSNVYFSIVKPEAVQCVSEVIPSTQENNPLFCGIQGALLVFSSQATAIWIGIIILNLHIHTVWNSNIIGEKYLYLHIIGWGIPAILTAVALGTKSINYQFATLCLIDVSKSNEIFFYPLAFIVLPSFFVHMATFFYIYKISRKDESKESNSSSEFMTYRRHVLQVVKIQWRALLLSVLLLVTVIFYWLFYFIELNTIATDTRSLDFIKNWLICIQSGRGQDYCSNLVNMPPYDLLITAEVLTSLIGIYSIIIFFNKTLWLEWGQWIREHFGSSCRGREVGEVYPI